MSMLCSLYRISATDAKNVIEFPDTVNDLLGSTPLPAKAGFFSRLFGKSKVIRPKLRLSYSRFLKRHFRTRPSLAYLHYLYSGCEAEGEWPSASSCPADKKLEKI